MHEDCLSPCRSLRPWCAGVNVCRILPVLDRLQSPIHLLIEQTDACLDGRYGRSDWKGVVFDCSTSPFKPRKQVRPHICRNLEVNRTINLLLDEHGAGPNNSSSYKSSKFDFHKIATPKLAVIARSNSVRSLVRLSRSKKKRIAHIWRYFKGFLIPTLRPPFQAGRPDAVESYCAIPI